MGFSDYNGIQEKFSIKTFCDKDAKLCPGIKKIKIK